MCPQAYSPAVLEDLLCRFEPPNAQTRWDTPLHTVTPGGAVRLAAELAPLAIGLTTPTAGPGAVQIVVHGPLAVVARELRPNLATATPALSHTNLLHELDAAAQAVVLRLAEAQAAAGAGLAPGRVEVWPHDVNSEQ